MDNHLCEYGCDQEAKHQFKNGKWCCSKFITQCPYIKKVNSEKNKDHKMSIETKRKISKTLKGRPSSLKGIPRSKEIREKIRATCKNNPNSTCFKIGNIPWSKGLTKKTDKRLKNLSDKFTGQKASKIQRHNQSKSKKLLYKNKKNHPSYKGEYYSNKIPLYDTYAHQLTIEEKPKRYKLDLNVLTVLCAHCKLRHIPKLSSVQERCRSLNGKQHGEQRLYCSEECKANCSIYNKHSYQEDHPKNIETPYTLEEYNTWRNIILEQDNYKCQMCGSKEHLHCHHIIPVKLKPMFSLDPDNGIVLCKDCHYKYGHKIGTECSTGNLANKICI